MIYMVGTGEFIGADFPEFIGPQKEDRVVGNVSLNHQLVASHVDQLQA